MKLNTFSKLLIVTVLIAFTQCAKLHRNQAAAKDGEGSWNDGFLCPRIEVGPKGKDLTDQGEGRFYPKNFVDAQVSAEDKLGFIIQFTKEPADLIKTKVGVKITANKYYIPYRFFTSKIEYTNPSGLNNKFFKTTLTNDDGEEFTLKIVLPWKLISRYINDDEANKIANKIESSAVKERNLIKNIKDDLLTQFSQLQSNKPLLETSEKNFADLAKALEESKKTLETNKNTAKTLEKQISDVEKQIFELQEKIKPLQTQKDSLSNDYKVVSESIANSEKSLNEKSGGASTQKDAINKYKPLVEASNKKVDELINSLGERAPEKKTTVITTIKTAITGLKQKDLNDNLKKIRSS